MIRNWRWPIVAGLLVAALAYAVTLRRAPTMLMAAAERRLEKLDGVNRFAHAPLATAASRAVVRPSPDLAYSSCVFDASKAPVLVDVAPVPARYWSLSVFGANTDVAFVRNNVEAGNAPIRLALVTPGQAVPAGYTGVLMPGGHGVALVRILVDDRARFALVDQARRVSTCGVAAGG